MVLLRCYQCYRVAADEEFAKLALDFAVFAFFRVFEYGVDVDIEGLEFADVSAAVFQVYDDPFMSCLI